MIQWKALFAALLGTLVLVILLSPNDARAQACTHDVNCFCACVQNTDGGGNDVGGFANADCQTAGIPKVSGVDRCADFEHPNFYSGTTPGGGSPGYGPWFDATGEVSAGRSIWGANSIWTRLFGGSVAQVPHGEPTARRFGDLCDTTSDTGSCWGAPEYCGEGQGDAIDGNGANCWGTNSIAWIDIMRAADFTSGTDDEGTMPLKPDGSRGLYGNTTFAGRIKDGDGGFLTEPQFANTFSGDAAICVTMKVAYSANSDTVENSNGDTIWDNPWKHDEWGPRGSGWPLFGQRYNCSVDEAPMCNVLWLKTPNTMFCPDYIGNVSINGGIGSANCSASDSQSIVLHPDEAYSAAADWPSGKNKWAFVRGKISGLTGSTWRFQTWVTIGNAPEIPMIDASVSSASTILDPYDNFRIDTYSNTIAGAAPNFPNAVRRFTDDYLITSGADCTPLTAAEAGFDPDAPAPDISISSVTITPDSGNAPLNGVDVSVSYSSNTGAVDLYVDCAGGTNWGAAVVTDDAASPVSASDVCSFPSHVTAPTQVAVRIVDSDADEAVSSDGLTVSENSAKWNAGAITSPTSGLVDSPFYSYDGRRIYFTYVPLQFLDFALGTQTYPAGQALSGHVPSGETQPTADLYFIEWDGSAWSAPQNLGTNVNTAINEVGPWVSDDELTLYFYRHGGSVRQNMKATRADRDAAWGSPVVMDGDYGDDNQTATRTRADIIISPADGDIYLWEHRDVSVSTKLGRLMRGDWNGSTWAAPVGYDGANYDLEAIDETQPFITRDGLTLLFNRRSASDPTELWKVTRASTGVDFTAAPTEVTLTGFPTGWGEVSADGKEQGFVAQAIDWGNPGGSSHLIRLNGTPASSSFSAPTVLNIYSPPFGPPTLCCRGGP